MAVIQSMFHGAMRGVVQGALLAFTSLAFGVVAVCGFILYILVLIVLSCFS